MNDLASPEFLALSLHVATIFAIPIHILGFYCILFQTPKSMKSVKWCLFNLHFWSVFMDITLSLFVCPYMIIPALAGNVIGLFSRFGVPQIVQFYSIITTFLAVGGSIVSIVENRYFMIFAKNTRWRHARYPFLILNYVFVFTFYIPPLLNVPDQEYAFLVIQETYPGIPLSVYTDTFFVIAIDNFQLFVTVFIASFTFVTEITVFNFLLLVYMRNRNHKIQLSPRTYEMQKKFLIAITIQISIPMFLLLIPAIYFEFSMISSFYNQVYNNFGVILISVHGWISTVVMLWIHEPYRNYCLRMVQSPKVQARRDTISTHI